MPLPVNIQCLARHINKISCQNRQNSSFYHYKINKKHSKNGYVYEKQYEEIHKIECIHTCVHNQNKNKRACKTFYTTNLSEHLLSL